MGSARSRQLDAREVVDRPSRRRACDGMRRPGYGNARSPLRPVDKTLADLVKRGKDSEVFGRHLPAQLLSQVAYATVFSIADNSRAGESLTARAATLTSLLILGVPEARANTLVDTQPSRAASEQ